MLHRRPHLLIALLCLGLAAATQAQVLHAQATSEGPVGVIPTGSSLAYGAIAESSTGDLYAAGGDSLWVYRMRLGEVAFTPYVQMITPVQALSVSGDILYIGIEGSRVALGEPIRVGGTVDLAW